MTRDEFIDGYMQSSEIPREYRTEAGFRFPDAASKYEQVAMPCACGEMFCEGWVMISNDPLSIKHHEWFNSPMPRRRAPPAE